MKSNIFPDSFEVHDTKMRRCFRFHAYDNEAGECCDYVVAREVRTENTDPKLIEVFKIDPVTGHPCAVSITDDVYCLVGDLFPRWQEAGSYLQEYRRKMKSKYGGQILPYLEDIEFQVLSVEPEWTEGPKPTREDALAFVRETAKQLNTGTKSKNRILEKLCNAMCKGYGKALPHIEGTAQELVFYLCGQLHGIESALQMLADMDTAVDTIKALRKQMIRDLGGSVDAIFAVNNRFQSFMCRPFFLNNLDEALTNLVHIRHRRDCKGLPYDQLKAIYLTQILPDLHTGVSL